MTALLRRCLFVVLTCVVVRLLYYFQLGVEGIPFRWVAGVRFVGIMAFSLALAACLFLMVEKIRAREKKSWLKLIVTALILSSILVGEIEAYRLTHKISLVEEFENFRHGR